MIKQKVIHLKIHTPSDNLLILPRLIYMQLWKKFKSHFCGTQTRAINLWRTDFIFPGNLFIITSGLFNSVFLTSYLFENRIWYSQFLWKWHLHKTNLNPFRYVGVLWQNGYSSTKLYKSDKLKKCHIRVSFKIIENDQIWEPSLSCFVGFLKKERIKEALFNCLKSPELNARIINTFHG